MTINFNFTDVKDAEVQAKKDAVNVKDILSKIDITPIVWDQNDIFPEVKIAGTVDEYTDEQVIELKKCMHPTKGVFHFALNYIYILHPMKGMIRWEPRKYQIRLLQAFLENRFNIVMSSRQVGKCVSKDTIIKLRHKNTGEILIIEIGKFFEMFDKL